MRKVSIESCMCVCVCVLPKSLKSPWLNRGFPAQTWGSQSIQHSGWGSSPPDKRTNIRTVSENVLETTRFRSWAKNNLSKGHIRYFSSQLQHSSIRRSMLLSYLRVWPNLLCHKQEKKWNVYSVLYKIGCSKAKK